MPSESIIWTALPHGLTGQGANRRLLVSIVASPRLDDISTTASLQEFREFAHWTQRVADSTRAFEIRWRSGELSGSTAPLPALQQPLNPAIWDRLIWEPAEVEIRPRSVRASAVEQYASYPSATGFAAVRENYKSAAVTTILGSAVGRTNEDTLESLRVLRAASEDGRNVEWTAPDGRRYLVRGPEEALRISTERAAERRRLLDRDPARFAGDDSIPISAFEPMDAAVGVDPIDDHGRSSVAIAEIVAFLQQSVLASKSHQQANHAAPGPPEFHELMTAIGNYQDLSRRLGLIFEIEVPVSQLGFTNRGFIQVDPQWSPAITATPILPWSAVDVSSGRPYSSLQHPSKIDQGFLVSSVLGAGRLDLVPIDLASVSLKLGLMSQPESAAGLLPTLRTAGFAVVRAQQGAIVHAARSRAARNDARLRTNADVLDADVELYAEDLSRGYRLDVQAVDSGVWHSLHQVDRTFTSGSDSWTVREEGLHQISGIEGTATDGTPYLLVDETISGWAGWSASAHRPGASLQPDGVPVDPPPFLDLGGIEVRQRVAPGSLPRMRYGKQYQFRVRTVDLAGNARNLSDRSTNEFTMLPAADNPITLLRYEPLEPPVLLQLAPLGDGEAIDRLVVRSSSNRSARAFARENRSTALANQRHLVPAKSTQLVAELHGMFDDAFGTGPGSAAARARAYEIAKREGASLSGSATEAPPQNAATAPIYPEPMMEIPYLPDPMGRGVALRNLPGPRGGRWGQVWDNGVFEFKADSAIRHGNVARILYGDGDDWPDLRPFRIQLQGTTGVDVPNPKFNVAERLLTVSLPPGDVFTVGLRTAVDFGDLDRLGVWQWAVQGLDDLEDSADAPAAEETPSIRRKRATAGDFWFLTPERPLQLVHAVQQPLAAPEIRTISASRPQDATYAELQNDLLIHARTTARIDLSATWTDKIDPVSSRPYSAKKQAHVRSQQINVFDGYDDWTRKEFREASWLQKDSQMLTVYGALENPGFLPLKPVDPEGAPLPIPSNPKAPVRHEFGDTRYRQVTYKLSAGTRFRDYFPESVTSNPANITLESDEVTIDVPSASRPAAPIVPYALPAFRWKTSTFDQPRQRWGGIRVYLERPWYSSGDNEKLAVVLWAGSSWPPDAGTENLVTRWGFDPIWNDNAGVLGQRPTAANFPLRDPRFDNQRYSLPGFTGVGNPPFAIAAHDVSFPEDGDVMAAGRCWCDIQIDAATSYTPFMRLAVARFQPVSRENAHLSPVALTDFVQIAAHRTVSLARQGAGVLSVTVSGEASGRGFAADGTALAGNQIDVALERRVPGMPDEFGWEPVSATVTPAPSLPAGTRWQGTVGVPTGGAAGQHRLVIREYERLPSDAAALGRRLVFADTIPLP